MSEQKSSLIGYKPLKQKLSSTFDDDDGYDDQGDTTNTTSSTLALPFNLRRSYFCTTVTALVVVLFTIGFLPLSFDQQIKTSSAAESSSTLPQDSSPSDHDHKNTIYGHVHVAKSGGTSLVYQLAVAYNKVCSNKSNSKDIVMKNLDKYDSPNWSRQFKKVLDQCDYISAEYQIDFWLDTQWSKPLELHVPCKDPIELLMSNCYFPAKRHVGFDCSPEHVTEEALGHQIDECLKGGKRLRFEKGLYETASSHNITLKCFNYKKEFTDYIEYMDERLEHNPSKEGLVGFKNGKLVDYPKPSSHTLRNISSECIWKDWDLKERVKGYLLEHYFYFRYCAECLNSSDDLFSDSSNVEH